MVESRHVSPKPGDVVLLVGTMKGAFLFCSSRARRTWERGGPYFPGHAVYALAWDGRAGRSRIWAGPESAHWGAVLRASDDFGRSWSREEAPTLRFPEDTGTSLRRLWQIVPGRPEEPDVLYCGVEPAALFESRDAGTSWSLVRGLWDHPHRSRWAPGAGGLCLHTILPHPTRPERLHVAISTGGVYRTDDGGRSWRTAHRGVRAQFLPDPHPEFGQCVHKVARHPDRPDRLFLQNHFGLYRTDDGGESWKDVARGVPSDFGFAMAVHPHEPDTVYIVPLESDEFRCTPEGRLRVYRTRDAGRSWQPLTRGLPQKEAFETVLRDAMTTDSLPAAGIYFGTRSGRVFVSSDGGGSWRLAASGLPPVVCVRAVVVEGSRRGGSNGKARGRRARPARGRRPSPGGRATRAGARRRRPKGPVHPGARSSRSSPSRRPGRRGPRARARTGSPGRPRAGKRARSPRGHGPTSAAANAIRGRGEGWAGPRAPRLGPGDEGPPRGASLRRTGPNEDGASEPGRRPTSGIRTAEPKAVLRQGQRLPRERSLRSPRGRLPR